MPPEKEAVQAFPPMPEEHKPTVQKPIEEAPKPIEVSVTVVKKEIYTISGESVVYLTDADGMIYKKQLSTDEAMLFIAEGDELTISYFATGVEKLGEIVSWTKK